MFSDGSDMLTWIQIGYESWCGHSRMWCEQL